MTYAAVNDDFSTFERDNVNRFLGVSFLASISEVSDRVLRKPDWPKVEALLIEADNTAAQARSALAAGEYELGVPWVRDSHRPIREAADILCVPVEPESNTADIRTPPDPPTALLTDGLDVSGILSSAAHHSSIDRLVEHAEQSIPFENAPIPILNAVPAYLDG
jgi:hypothetical protein